MFASIQLFSNTKKNNTLPENGGYMYENKVMLFDCQYDNYPIKDKIAVNWIKKVLFHNKTKNILNTKIYLYFENRTKKSCKDARNWSNCIDFGNCAKTCTTLRILIPSRDYVVKRLSLDYVSHICFFRKLLCF